MFAFKDDSECHIKDEKNWTYISLILLHLGVIHVVIYVPGPVGGDLSLPLTLGEQLPGLRELLQPCQPFHQIFICTLGRRGKNPNKGLTWTEEAKQGSAFHPSYIADTRTHLDVDDEVWRHFEVFDQLNLLAGPHESVWQERQAAQHVTCVTKRAVPWSLCFAGMCACAEGHSLP